MSDYTVRAETALRTALAERSQVDFVPFDPDALRAAAAAASAASAASASVAPRSRRIVRWLPAVAAVLVAMLVLPVGLMLALSRSAPMSAVPAAGEADRGVSGLPASVGGAGLSALIAGFRYESVAGTVVQVPENWGYGHALGSDWCAKRPLPSTPTLPAEPFVDVPGAPVVRVACPELPVEQASMHLTWWRAGEAARDVVPSGWVRWSRTVGDVTLSVVAPASEQARADQILASAQRVDVDHNGCATAIGDADFSAGRPAAGRDLASVAAVRSLVYCQYVSEAGRQWLVTSRRLSDAAATSAVARLASGPVVVPASGSCVSAPSGRSSTGRIVVKVTDAAGTSEAWVKESVCGSSVVDDGVGVRELQSASCAELVAPPLNPAYLNLVASGGGCPA